MLCCAVLGWAVLHCDWHAAVVAAHTCSSAAQLPGASGSAASLPGPVRLLAISQSLRLVYWS